MAGDPPPERSDDPFREPPGAGQGWTALSYLIGGIAVWGLIGWLVDRWLDTGGIAMGVGALVGAAGGIYLVVQRLGK